MLSAYRTSYEVFVGPIPDGMMICHRCDVPACINPAHLFVGDNATNIKDAAAKGRLWVQRHPAEAREKMRAAWAAKATFWFGSRVQTSKLTEADVRAIRASPNTNYAEIARQYGVATGSIHKIRKRKTWKHI